MLRNVFCAKNLRIPTNYKLTQHVIYGSKEFSKTKRYNALKCIVGATSKIYMSHFFNPFM